MVKWPHFMNNSLIWLTIITGIISYYSSMGRAEQINEGDETCVGKLTSLIFQYVWDTSSHYICYGTPMWEYLLVSCSHGKWTPVSSQMPVVSSHSKADSNEDAILSAQKCSLLDVLGFLPFCLIVLLISDSFLPDLYSEFNPSPSVSRPLFLTLLIHG